MQYNKWMDDLKVIATFAVIVLHVSSFFVSNYSVDNSYWWAGNFYEALSRFSVPIFFMLSGSLAINGNSISLTMFFRKKISRILIPFFFWSIFYSFITFFKSIVFDYPLNLSNFFYDMLNGDSYYHLWFIYTLFFLYLFTPLIKFLCEGCSRSAFIFSLVMIFIFNFFEIFLVIDGSEIQNLHPFLLAFIYLPYFYIGAYISNNKFIYNSKLLFCLGFFVPFNLILFLASAYEVSYAYSYISIAVASIALTIYLFARDDFFTDKILQWSKCYPYLFGVYLIHPIFIDFTYLLGSLGLPFGKNAKFPFIYIPLISIVIFLLSCYISSLLIRSRMFSIVIGSSSKR